MIGDAARTGIDMIQIRERDLGARELTRVARAAAGQVAGTTTRLFVNDRFDVALAAGADGVHLTTRSLPVGTVRACVGGRLRVGVSTHAPDEAHDAGAAGADFVVCGPVYDTPSKRGLGAPIGPSGLARAAAATRVPVLALGGLTRANAGSALAAGAAGIAAIRLFQEAWLEGGRERLAALVAELRSRFDSLAAPDAPGAVR